jgi:hypothetical protein
MAEQGDPERAATQQALALFEIELQERGEAACIASLPALVDEIAADVGGDGEQVTRALRERAGLHA